MATNTYLSSDYITRRGAEETTTGFKNGGDNERILDRSTIIGQSGLTKTSISSFAYNFAKQFFENKGIEEPVARSLILIANDIAKLHNKPIQVVLEEMESDGKRILFNHFNPIQLVPTLSNGQIIDIKVLNHGIGYYSDFTVYNCSASNSDIISSVNSMIDIKVGHRISDDDDNVLGQVVDIISSTEIQIDQVVTLNDAVIVVRPNPTITITGNGFDAEYIGEFGDDSRLSLTMVNVGYDYTTALVEVPVSPIVRQDILHIKAHGYETGDRIYFKAGLKTETESTLPPEIEEVDEFGKVVPYYAIAVNKDQLKLAMTEKDARLELGIPLSQPSLLGKFTIYKYFDLNLGVDSYIYMNLIRPTSNQMMAMQRVSIDDSYRRHKIQP